MLGAVVLNYKTYKDTILCVSQLKQQISSEDRIYIVDNDSPDESLSILSEEYLSDGMVTVIDSKKNGGFSYGNNVGFKKAIEDGCDEILCTNNDIEFLPNCIDFLRKALSNNSDVAVVGPKVYTREGDIQDCNKTKLTAFRFLMSFKPLYYFDIFGANRRYRLKSYKYDKEIKFDGMVSGCCFLIKASVLKNVDFLDEGVFLYYEEDILAAKLKRTGYKTMIVPYSEIVHFGSGTIGKTSPFMHYCKFKSGLYCLWNYSNTGRFKIKLLLWWINIVFSFAAIKNKEYKKYKKQLTQYVKKMLSTKRTEV